MSSTGHSPPPDELPSLARFSDGMALTPRRASASAVAALATGLASDLIAQVASRSPDWPEHQATLAQADALRDRSAVYAGDVAASYHGLVSALDAAVAQDHRADASAALGNQLDAAAELLLGIAETACDTAELAVSATRSGDTVVRADAACAAVLAAAAAEIAARLVEVNLVTSAGDERTSVARRLMSEAAASRSAAVAGLE